MTVAAAINSGVQWGQSQQNSLQGKDFRMTASITIIHNNSYYLLSESGWRVDAY